MVPIIVRVLCEDGVTDVPITPDTTCSDVVECCRDPGEDICNLVQIWRGYERVLQDEERPLEILQEWGPQQDQVKFVLRYTVLSPSPPPGERQPLRNGMREQGLLTDTLPNTVELSLWELQDMATRQQQQIESQQQMLVAKEQRLRYLKHQEARTHQVAAEKERLRRLKERVEAQELKLRKLRALRGQVDQDKANNTNLTSDLDSIRALFNEKEKELSLAVAKVEELTRQLEELKRSGRGKESHAPATAALELDKLRRELLFRNKLKEQQHVQLSQQREALNQRQEEMTNIDKRITELQDRLHRKRVLNQELATQLQHTNGTNATNGKMPMKQVQLPANYQRQNVAAVEPYLHIPSATNVIKQHIEDTIKNATYHKTRKIEEKPGLEQPSTQDEEKELLAEFGASKSDPKYQTLPYNTKFQVNYSKALPNGVGQNHLVSQAPQAHTPPTTQPSRIPSHLTPRVYVGNTVGTRGQPVGGVAPTTKPTSKLSKPVSSVAPTNIVHKPARSFVTSHPAAEKPSPIYQTSSTKILPVQPQVLATTPQAVPKESKAELALSPPVSTSTPVSTPEALDPRGVLKPALPPKPAVPVKPTPPTPPPPPRQTPEAKGYIEITAESLDQALISVNTRLDEVPSKTESPPPPPPPPTSPPPDEGKPNQSITNNRDMGADTGTDEADRAVTVPGADLTELEEKDSVRDEVEALNNLNNLNAHLEVISVPGDVIVRRIKKGNLKSTSGRVHAISRRVSFDPLALLLDASLEGELELVMKTAAQVTNPSSANDEGITALHNAICAGHLEIVKFLVEFGCDVNAQDSDGWTPLHCAASCNNLAMVRFLVEHGACIFATTLSDHETAAEKCEEDEEGFDGCSEYLYSIQEKLGILNNGAVYAVYDYSAHNADELCFKEGDKLVILRKGDELEREWWWARLHEREGYTPRNLLGLYPRVHPTAKAE